jgi:hypothetical protein
MILAFAFPISVDFPIIKHTRRQTRQAVAIAMMLMMMLMLRATGRRLLRVQLPLFLRGRGGRSVERRARTRRGWCLILNLVVLLIVR